MLTKIEIIDETIEYYSTHPRSKGYEDSDGARCLYNGPNGLKCAFSRCCTDDSKFQEGTGAVCQSSATLLPQYSHIPIHDDFWYELQRLHDSDGNWEGQKLTPKGIKYLKDLKSKHL